MKGWSTWPAPAKLNLFLRITARRADGYHDLQTVFRLLNWGDQIRLRVRDDGAIVRNSSHSNIVAEDDLSVSAARALQHATGTRLGVDMEITKRIPVGAGLGGGSSDAATVLVALNALWNTCCSRAQLAEIGLKLGADVPVFVHGRSAWAEGVGEKLTPLALPPRWYVVLDSHAHVSTADLFQAPELTRNAAPATMADFASGAMTDNVFEPVVGTRYREVAAALDWLKSFGAPRLSGSGGAVFLETASEIEAREVATRCPREFTAHVARGVDVSPLESALKQFQGGG